MANYPKVNLRNSIATRLLSYVFSIYLVISIIITVIHMVYEYRRVEKNVIQDLNIFYQNSNPTMAVALWEADREQMDSVLNGFVKSPIILGLKISDLSGKYVRTIGKSIDIKEELRFTEQGEQSTLIRQEGSSLFGFQYPIVYARESGKHKIGSMTLYSSPSVIFSRVKFSYLFIFINAIIKTIILWVVFLWFSRLLLQRPLSILTSAAQKIDLENLEKIQIDTKTSGRNEFKILEEAFNNMVLKLLEARNDIAKTKEEQNRRLEKQVIARTRELSDSKERYRRLVELAPLGIAIHQEGTLVFMNAAGKKIINGTESQLTEDKPILEMVHPDSYKEMTQKIQGLTAADNPETPSFEDKIIRLDGSTTNIEVVGIQFIYNNKPAVQVVFQDITDRKKWEAALRKESKQAEKENQAKGRFLANMSHELRTPLNAILGLSQLMTKNSNLNHEQKDNLHIISRSGKHLLDLINDILDMSKIEAKKISVVEDNLSLFSFLEDVQNLFKFQTKRKKLTLLFEQSPGLPPYIRTDEVKLRQILTNLINNALKFTEQGGVIVRITTAKKDFSIDKTGKKSIILNFEIEDTGPGIYPENMEHIFDPFVQIHSGHGQKEGTGLGLSISLKFAQLMGGDIQVESKPGSGSVFKLTLPVSPGKGEQNQTLKPTPIMWQDPQPNFRILIVDDVDSDRRVLWDMLSSMGFELKDARNGQQAVKICRDWQPHLVWMDIHIPEMEGYDVMGQIKAEQSVTKPVIIALTSSSLEEDRRLFLDNGGNDFVSKPFQENEILQMVSKYIGGVYEPKGEDPKSETLIPVHQMQQAIVNLPGELKAEVKKAVVLVDFDKTLILLAEIQKENKTLADALTRLVNGYQFNILQTLFEEVN